MDGSTQIDLKPEWQLHRKTWGHPFHPMCSYLATFPARIPHYFIQKFTRPGDVVLDPFSGSGATPLQACAEKRIGIGVDLNPIAYLLTAAKVDPPEMGELLARVEDLENDMFYGDVDGEPGEIRLLFHDFTLGQLAYLKGMLQREDRRDRFILAVLLGALHGAPGKSDSKSDYLSPPMPNTVATSPEQIGRYLEAHNLGKTRIDVFEVLRRHIERLFKQGPPLECGYAYQCDAKRLAEIPNRYLKRRGINLIVTSPPCLKTVRYGLHNWIRLWLLNEDPAALDGALDQHPRLEDYLLFTRRVLQQLYRVLAPGGVCAIVIGDVKKPRSTEALNVAEEVWRFMKKRGTGYGLAGIVEDALPENAKVSRILGAVKPAKAPLIDRVLVLYKERIEEAQSHVAW